MIGCHISATRGRIGVLMDSWFARIYYRYMQGAEALLERFYAAKSLNIRRLEHCEILPEIFLYLHRPFVCSPVAELDSGTLRKSKSAAFVWRRVSRSERITHVFLRSSDIIIRTVIYLKKIWGVVRLDIRYKMKYFKNEHEDY